MADAFSSSQAAWGDVQNAMTHHWSKSKSSSKPVGKTVGKSPKGASWCWAEHAQVNLALHYETATLLQRCDDRHGTLAEAQAACEAARPWCGGVTRDSGMDCARGGKRRQYELRLADKVDAPASVSVTSWLLHRTAKNSTRCEGGSTGGARRAARALRAPTLLHADDRLGHVLRAKLEIAQHRVARGPPAFERFPEQAYRYRDWGAQTRHGRGDMYPLYTLDTLRNLADFLFDSSTGYDSAPERARRVPACALLYSTLRPTTKFINMVHSHIKVPYLLMTDTADEPITAYHGVKQLLASNTLRHWWAVDNEVLDHPKLEGLPLGVMDALELGAAADPRSVAFHANVSKYLSTLIESEQQTKGRWLMMQMTETHPERRRVRSSIVPDKWGDEEVRLTPERRGKMGVYDYLMELGQHRFVLSPRGNGLDAHRTWEALLVGCIPSAHTRRAIHCPILPAMHPRCRPLTIFFGSACSRALVGAQSPIRRAAGARRARLVARDAQPASKLPGQLHGSEAALQVREALCRLLGGPVWRAARALSRRGARPPRAAVRVRLQAAGRLGGRRWVRAEEAHASVDARRCQRRLRCSGGLVAGRVRACAP